MADIEAQEATSVAPDTYDSSSRGTKFRFKSKKRHRKDDDLDRDTSRSHEKRSRRSSRSRSPRRSREHTERRHRSSRHHRSDHKSDPSAPRRHGVSYDDETPEETYRATVADALAGEPYMSPTQAFQESLFDAMADDEGAAYWEGVYGQPIHVYAKEKVGPEGELEKMTDEEYATYVRGRMWEKSHPQIVEERERREQARQRKREEEERRRRDGGEYDDFQDRIERSLGANRDRKRKKGLEVARMEYEKRWLNLKNALLQPPDDSHTGLQHQIAWPVDSLRRKHVNKENVCEFMQVGREDDALMTILKIERVKWHPDKMKQRFGAHGISEDHLSSVTAVFQILDDLWREVQSKHGK